MGNDALIEFKNVTRSFGNRNILNSISLAIAERKIIIRFQCEMRR